jgi:hypothetical protein
MQRYNSKLIDQYDLGHTREENAKLDNMASTVEVNQPTIYVRVHLINHSARDLDKCHLGQANS